MKEKTKWTVLASLGLGLLFVSLEGPRWHKETEQVRRKILQCGEVIEVVECVNDTRHRCTVLTEKCDLVRGVPQSEVRGVILGDRVSLVTDGVETPFYDYLCVNGTCSYAVDCQAWMPCFHF